MNPLLEYMLQFVEQYRYLAVFILTFLGAVALPIPTGSMMIGCGFLVTLGIFDAWWLFVVGLLGNIIGDHTGYWMARSSHNVKKLPLIGRLAKSQKFQTVARQVHDRPWSTIVFSRFMTAVAPSVNVVAGLSHYPYGKFWFFEGVGEVVEVGVTLALGLWFGQQWLRATEYMGLFLVIVAIGIVSSILFWKWLSERSQKAGNIPS